MHEVQVNRLGGLSLPRKSVVRLTDRPDMTLDVYRGRKNNNSNATYNTIRHAGICKAKLHDVRENKAINFACKNQSK